MPAVALVTAAFAAVAQASATARGLPDLPKGPVASICVRKRSLLPTATEPW